MIDGRNRTTGVAFWKAAAALIAMVLIAGATSRARAQSATQDEVLKLQTQFQDAVVAGNVDAIAPMMADDAIFIHGNGVMQGKAEFLAAIKNGQLPLSAYELKEPRVILFDGGAIVSGLEDLAFKPRPGSAAPPLVIHMRGSAVWVRGAAGWHLLLDQDTTLAGPPAAHPPSAAPSR
ncbi:MAG TPA: nuclear transport factor 2 family protein [Candidatus Polarisedimenticolia bacterium]|nr:nuclear transport factor 2 family protein [Candidatus Polarisedimenticolia bacterium]